MILLLSEADYFPAKSTHRINWHLLLSDLISINKANSMLMEETLNNNTNCSLN